MTLAIVGYHALDYRFHRKRGVSASRCRRTSHRWIVRTDRFHRKSGVYRPRPGYRTSQRLTARTAGDFHRKRGVLDRNVGSFVIAFLHLITRDNAVDLAGAIPTADRVCNTAKTIQM